MNVSILLQQFGLSENETAVYIAALECGMASAQQIGQTANIKRTTAYAVLDNLVRRGLVGKTEVKGKTRFVAEPPNKLLSLVRDLQHQLTEALPQLEALYNAKEVKPKITFYEGEQAIQNVLDDTLRERPAEILEWNTHKYFEKFARSHDYIDERAALNIRARRMAGKGSVWDTKHKAFDKIEKSQSLIVPKDYFWPDIEVNIYNNKVAFLNYVDDMSVIIDSKPIADAMRQAYELSWIGAQTLREQ